MTFSWRVNITCTTRPRSARFCVTSPPQRYRGTCYKAAGWQALGQTKGFERSREDFYVDMKQPKELWVREYWWIEDKQHYRRDHTQREDHCQVRNTVAARNLSILRSGAIFLFEHQRSGRGAKRSLPDWQRKNIRHPNALIKLLVG